MTFLQKQPHKYRGKFFLLLKWPCPGIFRSLKCPSTINHWEGPSISTRRLNTVNCEIPGPIWKNYSWKLFTNMCGIPDQFEYYLFTPFIKTSLKPRLSKPVFFTRRLVWSKLTKIWKDFVSHSEIKANIVKSRTQFWNLFLKFLSRGFPWTTSYRNLIPFLPSATSRWSQNASISAIDILSFRFITRVWHLKLVLRPNIQRKPSESTQTPQDNKRQKPDTETVKQKPSNWGAMSRTQRRHWLRRKKQPK
jgi:hypothetical protein